MERRLLTLLMLSAFGMNVSAYSFTEALSISQFFSKTVGNAKEAVLNGAEKMKDFFSKGKLNNRLNELSEQVRNLSNLNHQLNGSLTSTRQEVEVLDQRNREVAAQWQNRTRAAFGSAWSDAKYCGTKAKNAALWASRKVVNTTLGGKMNSLSTDWTSLTAGLDKTQKMNSVKQLGSNVRDSIKQLSSNAWTNKKASAKIAAATVATVVGVYYADKLVKSASKWLSGKRKAAANAN